MTIKVPNAGDAPLAGKGRAGDLLVRVNVASSKVFRRQGAHLHHEARIPLHTALLGGRVRVPTLDGEVDVRVPGGTQQGEEMVLKGRGVSPVFGGDKGDLFVAFSVQLPRWVSSHVLYVTLHSPTFTGHLPHDSVKFCNNMRMTLKVAHRWPLVQIDRPHLHLTRLPQTKLRRVLEQSSRLLRTTLRTVRCFLLVLPPFQVVGRLVHGIELESSLDFDFFSSPQIQINTCAHYSLMNSGLIIGRLIR